MSEAYLILPALYLGYFLSSSLTLRKKIINLSCATLVLVVVSLSWALAVDAVPAKDRPFVGSSTNNTVTELILGHNGFDRVKFSKIFKKPSLKIAKTQAAFNAKNIHYNNKNTNSGIGNESAPSLTRLIGNNNISDQVGFFIPMAVLGFLAAVLKEKLFPPFNDGRKMSLILFFTWFLTEFIFFIAAIAFMDILVFGGFSGNDNIISLNNFKKEVLSGKIKYAILPTQNNRLPSKHNKNSAIVNWIKKNGNVVSNSKWEDSKNASRNPYRLYYLGAKYKNKLYYY